jgi:hypothetical protein
MLIVDKRPIRPQHPRNLLPRQHLPRPLQQQQQHLERLRMHPHPHPLLPQLAGSRIGLKHPEAIPFPCTLRAHRCPVRVMKPYSILPCELVPAHRLELTINSDHSHRV